MCCFIYLGAQIGCLTNLLKLMKISSLFFVILLVLSIADLNAKGKTRNVIFITFDGLRWEEVFYGADSLLINNDDFTKERKSMVNNYWADTPKTRREKLMPFFWSTITTEGQLYGNVRKGSVVKLANPYWLSLIHI